MDIDTVTFSSVAPESVAVNVTEEPEFSAIELALEVNVTVGAVSFSVIVKVTCWLPFSIADPPSIEEISNIEVSSPS